MSPSPILTSYRPSPLFFAKTVDSVNLLISLRADLKTQSRAGHTPLLHHCQEGNTDSAIAILEHCIADGIDVDESDVRGRTFAHMKITSMS
jgi:ankyrin repeat protein